MSQAEAKPRTTGRQEPGRPKPEELVPSRYAVRIGEIEVLIISDGVLPLPTTMLGHNADAADRAVWLDDMFLPRDAFDWALNVVLVRSGGQTILIDAGLGLDPDLNLPRAGQLIKRLAGAGIDLASVTDVVLTHLHMDHIGGLLVDGVKDRCVLISGSTWRLRRPSSGRRPISATYPCRPAFRMRFGLRQSGSSASTAAISTCSTSGPRWRRVWSSNAPAAIPPAIAWSAWHPAATG